MDPTGCPERSGGGGAGAGSPARIACVDLPAWPLQLLLRRHPDWREGPAAVVAEDSPQAPLVWVNGAARRRGILPGLRYAAALSLAHDLRAGTVAARELAAAGERLHRHLRRYSPRVEAAGHEPGVFWLDAQGLDRLYGSPGAWAGRLHSSLVRADLAASVAVGFTRFGSYGLARTCRGVTVAATARDELAVLRRVPLVRLQLEPRLRDHLARLGVRTVGALCDLPEQGVGARFGAAAVELHRLARGAAFAPLQASCPVEPERAEEVLDEPESDAWRLLFLVKRALHPLLDRLADRLRAVTAAHLELWLADRAGTRLRETLRPAAPTLDAVLLLELIRLRLERLALTAGVERVVLALDDTAATAECLDLFAQQRRRDPAAAARALARVRAELGDAAVVRAELGSGHLPEARVRWAPLDAPPAAPPAAALPPLEIGPPPLVRRLLARPRPVPAPRPEFVCAGPFHLSGGWWRGEIRRAYCFVKVGGRELRWVFRDRRRRRWLLQGRVE
ncbi:MAG TPA: DNA polymerase Y family protein [Candidatus Krumholzibacteria bacterium]|nr:DNA polymerase Y family protein [Candidatus Krumholzibacteria bacterium]HPD72271.1 DNA polymerase Y family protein [Candidatus Krumholzibacteria bacterium]HRY40797.1 DNA polymerase Y family protein [Candidatus Krumholzibacteria bacterium]